VSFTEAVTVSGTPRLTLETGSTDQVIDYASGSGTDTLTFSYTIQAGDSSSDLTYLATDSLALNGGTIKNSASTDATLNLPSPTAAGSLAANKSIIVDTALPTVSSFSSTTADGSYKEGATINITATLSEVVTSPASITATLSNGQTVVLTHNAVNNTLTGSYTIGAGQSSADLGVSSYALTSAPVDSAGNVMSSTDMPAGNISGTRAIVVDTSAPTASLTAATVIGSGNASVQSSEGGTAYLIKSSVTVSSLASITGAADNLWNSVSVSANTATNLSASGLDLGDYVLYTADAAGNLSAVSSNTVTVSMGAPSTPDLNSSSDLGSSSTDNQTADDTPIIDLTGLTTGAVVTVTATPGTGSPVTCSFTATSGSGSCTFSSLANETYSFKASQTFSGVTSSDSSNLNSVVIFKTNLTPTVTLDLNSADDLGTSSTDNVTSATTLRITSSSGGVSYTFGGGSGSSSPCTSGCSFGTFSTGCSDFHRQFQFGYLWKHSYPNATSNN
jgi:large repetitive protein